ncbi:MAG: hypothetical protein HY862_13915 [Chloroflexi bacterium]|nr:hypothetical protein [Chloroflexota bacterium]
MLSERLLKVALKQSAIIVAVLLAVPTLGVLATLLLSTISTLFCEQLQGLMTLSVVTTAVVLTVQEFRHFSKP